MMFWEAVMDIQLSTVVVVVLGVVLGYVVGAFPGLTATMTIALLLPFSFGLTPLNAIALMVAVFIGAMNGGALSACMYNIPGTPSAAATGLDGYPLAQKGHFGRAISTATIASFVGSLVSVTALAVFSPVLADVALEFSAGEYFALAVLGLTIVASVSGRSLVKGGLAAALGVMVAMVGLDPMAAFPRYTFGTTILMNGFPLIAVLIGLFGISEVFKQMEAHGRMQSTIRTVNTDIISWAEIKGLTPNMLRSSTIGTVIGAIPGSGGVTAAFLSYREAMRFSKEPETFGKGALGGIAAPEAGNNGVTGGTMIPLLTLGIPGDAAAAVMLGAFLIHGITPGPNLFTEEPGLVYGLFVAMFIATIVMLVQGLSFIRFYAQILKVDPFILMPIVTVLTVVGAYATNSTLVDVVIMFAFGLVGYWFAKAGVPLAPLVLGLVLGPILESNLRRAVILDGGSFDFLYTRPITLGILVIASLSLLSSFWTNKRFAEE
jgi:putative tricarboxylic transport membrane protein